MKNAALANATMKHATVSITATVAVGGVLGWLAASGHLGQAAGAQDKATATASGTIDRTQLPIKEPAPPFATESTPATPRPRPDSR